MSCEYCGKYPHHCRCPLAPEDKYLYRCSICSEGIVDGEEYIKNDDGEFVHLECCNVRGAVEFLGYDVRTMENEKID